MRVVLLTTFKASRKEPLAALPERIHAAFLASGDGEPLTRFSFSDSPLPGSVSSVDRVLKRHPQLERFVSSAPMAPGGPPVPQISNGPASAAERWGRIVDNLAALVREFDRSFVPAVEAASGPSPDWYKPES